MEEDMADTTPEPSVRIADDDTDPTAAGSLVVGFDRRPESSIALIQAMGLATRLHARIHVVHAVDLGDFPADPDAADWEDSARAAINEELDQAQMLLAGTSIPWTFDVFHTDPARALILAAERTDAVMIVVGSRGEGVRTIVERLISPSVTHRLVNRSPRPVLVIGHRMTTPSPDPGDSGPNG
jgi:nucleotide-binding universal stress UspA family protein